MERKENGPLSRDWRTLSVEGPTANILGFQGHLGSFATSQLCSCDVKAAIANMQIVSMSVSIKLYLQQ